MFSVLHLGWTRNFSTANAWKFFLKSFSSAGMHYLSFYDALRISKSSTQSDIKAAYYKLSLQFHPDRNHGCEKALKKFQEIKQAYEVLGNSRLRRMYDKGVMYREYGSFHSANPSATSCIVAYLGDDTAKKDFKSRFRRIKVTDILGRTPVYNFDEWSRAHYGYSFQRKRELRKKYPYSEQQILFV